MKLINQIDRKRVIAGLVIGAGAVLVYSLLNNLPSVHGFFKDLMGYCSPVIWGLLLAYLLRPTANRLEKWLPKFIKSKKARLNIGTLTTILIVLVITAIVIYIVLPQLTSSGSAFVKNLDTYLDSVKGTLVDFADRLGIEDLDIEKYIGSSGDVMKTVGTWITDNLSFVVSTLMNLGSSAINLIIVLAIAIYALLDRRNLKASMLKLENAVIGKQKGARLNGIVQLGDKLMMKFLSSNLLDAFIIGIINFIFLGIVKAPYQALLSVFLGIINFIPTFGPIVGGFIAAFVVLLTKPSLLLGFLIFTLVLQQLDGNVIKPLLFGDSTGLSPFWVLVAIVVGGNIMGVMGMIIGVPVVALMSKLLDEVLDKRIAIREKAESAAQKKKENSDERL